MISLASVLHWGLLLQVGVGTSKKNRTTSGIYAMSPFFIKLIDLFSGGGSVI